MFVYISELCKREAREYQIEDKILELKSWVEGGDFKNFSELFEIFTHPYYVRKKVFYKYRLLARHNEITLDNERHQVVVFFQIFLRSDSNYGDFFESQGKLGDELYSRQQLEDKVVHYVKECLTTQHKTPQTPTPINEALALNYFANSKTNLLNLTSPPAEHYVQRYAWTMQIVGQLTSKQRKSVFERIQVGLNTGQPQRFSIGKIELLFEPLPIPTLGTPNAKPNPLDIKQPVEILLDFSDWLNSTFKTTSHLSFLTPLGTQVFDKIFNEPAAFPLLVNAPNLHGKSTLLPLLITHYFYQNDPTLAGLSCLSISSDGHHASKISIITYLQTHNFRSLNQGFLDTDYTHKDPSRILMDTILGTEESPFYESSFNSFGNFFEKLPFDENKFIDEFRFKALWKNSSISNQSTFDKLKPDFIWYILQIHIKGSYELDGFHCFYHQELFDVIYQKVWLDWYKPLCQSGYWDYHDLLNYFNENYEPRNLYKSIFIDDCDQYSRLTLKTFLRHSVFYQTPNLLLKSPIIFMGNDHYELNWQKNVVSLLENYQKEHDIQPKISPQIINYPPQLMSDVQLPIFYRYQELMGQQQNPPNDSISLNIYFIHNDDDDNLLSLLLKHSIAIHVNGSQYKGYQALKEDKAFRRILAFNSQNKIRRNIHTPNENWQPYFSVALVGFSDKSMLIDKPESLSSNEKAQALFSLMQLQKIINHTTNDVFIVGNDEELLIWEKFFNKFNKEIKIADSEFINPEYQKLLKSLNRKKENKIKAAALYNTSTHLIKAARAFSEHFMFKESFSLLLQASQMTQDFSEFFKTVQNTEQKEFVFHQLWQYKYKQVWLDYEQYVPEKYLGNLLALKMIHNLPINYTAEKSYCLALSAYEEQYQDEHLQHYWKNVLNILLEKMIHDKELTRFGQIHELIKCIGSKRYYLPFSTVAELYFEYQYKDCAIYYWELAREFDSEVPEKYYILKLENAKSWQEKVMPLLHLNQLGEVMSLLEKHDINNIKASYWKQILPYLKNNSELEAILLHFLPKIESPELLKYILEHCQADVDSRFAGRLQRLVSVKACLESDWQTVIDRFENFVPAQPDSILEKIAQSGSNMQIRKSNRSNSPANSFSFAKPNEEVVDMLYALSLNPELKVCQTASDYVEYIDKPHIQALFGKIREVLSSPLDPQDSDSIRLWNTKMDGKQAFVALMEKSNRLQDIIEIYANIINDSKDNQNFRKLVLERASFCFVRSENILSELTKNLTAETAETEMEKRWLAEYQRHKKTYTDFKNSVGKAVDPTSSYTTLPELPPIKTFDEIVKRILALNDKEQRMIAQLKKEQARTEKERLKKEQAEKEQAEKAEQERLAQAKLEQELAEKAEQERLAQEQAEQERIAKEQAEQERLAQEQAKREQIEREQAQKAEQERIAKEQAEKEQAEKAEQERLAQAKLEQELAEKAEQERLAQEQAEKAEQERLAQEQAKREQTQPPQETDGLPLPSVAPKPSISKAISDLTFFEWRVSVYRHQHRINIEHTATGQRCSLYLAENRLNSDWHYTKNGDTIAFIGTPLIIKRVGQVVVLCHSEQGIELVIR